MKKGVLIAGVLWRIVLLAPFWVGEAQSASAAVRERRAAVRGGAGVQVAPGSTGSSSSELGYEGNRLLPFLKGLQDSAYEKNLYALFLSVPRQIMIKYTFLEQLQKYLKPKMAMDLKPFDMSSLIAFIAQENNYEPLTAEFDVANLFARGSGDAILKNQSNFTKLAVSGSLPHAEMSEAQKRMQKDLTEFLRTYMDTYGYPKNMLIQLLIPKGTADELVAVQLNGATHRLGEFIQSGNSDNYHVTLWPESITPSNLSYAYPVPISMLLNKTLSTREKSDLDSGLADLVSVVGDEMIRIARGGAPSSAGRVPVARPADQPQTFLQGIEHTRAGLKKTEPIERPTTFAAPDDSLISVLQTGLDSRREALEGRDSDDNREGAEWDEEDL